VKVLYVSSGPSKVHQPIDRYIDLTFREMDIEYSFFDLTAHVELFKLAFDTVRDDYDIDYSAFYLLKYAAAPILQASSDFEPDLVLTMRGACIPATTVNAIKKMGAVTALWAVDDPYEIDQVLEYARIYDFVFTVEKAAVDIYREAGCRNVFQLPLAAFPGVHESRPVAPSFESDICFIGSGFYNRTELFDEIADYLVDGGLNVKIIGQWWDELKSFKKLKRFVSNELVYAADAAKYYTGAKINLNIHRAPDAAAHFQGNERSIEAFSPNNRTFEIAACGGFQLVDNTRPDLNKYFEVGREIDTFSTPEELIKKIDLYLGSEEKRKEMAHRAKQRCLEQHTFRHRLEFILEKTLAKDHKDIISQVVSSVNGDGAYLGEKDNSYYQAVNPFIVQAVPSTAKRVLDIGCGEGALGEVLKSLGIKEVCGVEINEAAASKAKKRLDKVIVGDIEEVELSFKNNYFDCIVYGDVLEHLKDPWRVLGRQRKFLAVGGKVIASIPNVLYLPVIKDLLRGRWRYEHAGVLDNTHLRFFTLRELIYMFNWAGYEIEDVKGLDLPPVDQEEVKEFVKKIKPLNIIPESLLTEMQYTQYLITAKKVKSNSKQGAGLCLVKS